MKNIEPWLEQLCNTEITLTVLVEEIFVFLNNWRTGVRKANFSPELPSGPGPGPLLSLTQLLSTIRLTMI